MAEREDWEIVQSAARCEEAFRIFESGIKNLGVGLTVVDYGIGITT